MNKNSYKYKLNTFYKKTRKQKPKSKSKSNKSNQHSTNKMFKEILGNVWITDPNNIQFPEMKQSLYRKYNPEGVSLAFSGGGRRAYSGYIGVLRGLYNIDIYNSNAFIKSQFVSVVSGSAWLLGTFLFANKNINKDLLLGKSIHPKDITLSTLHNTNFENNDFLGNRLIDVNIQQYLEQAYKKGIRPEYIWSYSIGQIFLKYYGLNDKIMALNDSHAKNIYMLTKKKPIIPSNNSPFLISNCSIINTTKKKKSGTTIFQVTPYYSGTLNTLCYKKKTNSTSCIGGVLQDTYILGSINPLLQENLLNNKDSIQIKAKIPLYQTNLFTLDSMIGVSGDSQIEKFTYISQNIIQSYNLWSPLTTNTSLCQIGDGAYCDVIGITSLLTRNVKHIIAFVSCSSDIPEGTTIHDYNGFSEIPILNLFGLYNNNYTNIDPNFNQSNDMQVFSKSDWPYFAKNILYTKSKGGPVYSRTKLQVLPNTLLGIKGGYDVDLLVIVIQKSRIFNNLLPKSISDTFSNESGPFPNFPNYPMVNNNLNKIMSITKEETNLLSSYCEWCIINTPLKHIIQQMYIESGV